MAKLHELNTGYVPATEKRRRDLEAQLRRLLADSLPHVDPCLDHLVKLYSPLLKLRKEIDKLNETDKL